MFNYQRYRVCCSCEAFVVNDRMRLRLSYYDRDDELNNRGGRMVGSQRYLSRGRIKSIGSARTRRIDSLWASVENKQQNGMGSAPGSSISDSYLKKEKMVGTSDAKEDLETSDDVKLVRKDKMDQEEDISGTPADTFDTQSSFNLPYSSQLKSFLRKPLVELFFCGLVLLSSFLVALSTLENDGSVIPDYIFGLLDDSENIIVAMFTVEFFARWYAFGQFTGRYLTKPLSIIDIFVVVLPFMLKMAPGVAMMLPQVLSSENGLITLTLLRVLRIQRILNDLDTFSEIEVALGLGRSDVRPYQLAVARVILSIFTLLTVASGMIYSAEHRVNPDIPDYFTALYFGLTTLTTVGFGDITPVTIQGKIVVCGSILFGVTVIPAQAAALVDALLDYQKERMLIAEAEEEKSEVILIDYDDSDFVFAVDQKVQQKSTAKNLDSSSSKICKNCGTSSHRNDATFCWSCGSSL